MNFRSRKREQVKGPTWPETWPPAGSGASACRQWAVDTGLLSSSRNQGICFLLVATGVGTPQLAGRESPPGARRRSAASDGTVTSEEVGRHGCRIRSSAASNRRSSRRGPWRRDSPWRSAQASDPAGSRSADVVGGAQRAGGASVLSLPELVQIYVCLVPTNNLRPAGPKVLPENQDLRRPGRIASPLAASD
jgi:hypothetical protein